MTDKSRDDDDGVVVEGPTDTGVWTLTGTEAWRRNMTERLHRVETRLERNHVEALIDNKARADDRKVTTRWIVGIAITVTLTLGMAVLNYFGPLDRQVRQNAQSIETSRAALTTLADQIRSINSVSEQIVRLDAGVSGSLTAIDKRLSRIETQIDNERRKRIAQ